MGAGTGDKGKPGHGPHGSLMIRPYLQYFAQLWTLYFKKSQKGWALRMMNNLETMLYERVKGTRNICPREQKEK